MFIFASIMAFIIEPGIAWIFLVAAAILFVLVLLIMNAAQPNFRQMFKKYDRLNAVAQENLTGIRVVKSYVLEGPEIDKYQKATQEVYDYSVRAEKLTAAMSPVVQVIMYVTMIILLAVGGASIVGGDLKIADLTGLLSYATQILSGVMMVAMVLTFIAMSRPAMERISEILSEESTIEDPADPVFEVKDGAIEFDHVSFAYRKGGEGEDVIKDVSLKIASGETIGIIGQTGSAKTTLVSLIPPPLRCDGGKRQSGRPRCEGVRPHRPPRFGCDGAAEERALLGLGRRESALGQGGCHAGGARVRLQTGVRRRVHRAAPREV